MTLAEVAAELRRRAKNERGSNEDYAALAYDVSADLLEADPLYQAAPNILQRLVEAGDDEGDAREFGHRVYPLYREAKALLATVPTEDPT